MLFKRNASSVCIFSLSLSYRGSASAWIRFMPSLISSAYKISSLAGYIYVSVMFSMDFCDMASKLLIESISSPQNSILTGCSSVMEKTSSMPPRIANSPGPSTCSTDSYPISTSCPVMVFGETSISDDRCIVCSKNILMLGKRLCRAAIDVKIVRRSFVVIARSASILSRSMVLPRMSD